MLDDTAIYAQRAINKPAVGNGSVALYGRIGRLFCLTFRAGVDVKSLLPAISSCHELLEDLPMWGPDWIAVGYDEKAAKLAIEQSKEAPKQARQQLLENIFASIWSGLFTGAINGRELVTTPVPPQAAPAIDLGVLMHRQAQW